jgi:hypothetical protein
VEYGVGNMGLEGEYVGTQCPFDPVRVSYSALKTYSIIPSLPIIPRRAQRSSRRRRLEQPYARPTFHSSSCFLSPSPPRPLKMHRNSYDSDHTVFSPAGRLHQVRSLGPQLLPPS